VPTVEKLQQLSALVTLRADVSDVYEMSARGYFGGAHVVLLVQGDVLLPTDLGKVRVVDIDHAAGRLILVLPEPQVVSARLDHESTRLYAVHAYGLWLLVPFELFSPDVINLATEGAQRRVADAGRDPEIRARARLHAETVLRSFCRQLGWDATARWDEVGP
jgi:hypothetical protein